MGALPFSRAIQTRLLPPALLISRFLFIWGNVISSQESLEKSLFLRSVV